MILPDVNVLVHAHNAYSAPHDGAASGLAGMPHVHIAPPAVTHFARLRAELEHLGTAGNLTTGAHLAVLAMERGDILYLTDADFARFSGLRWVNPCKEARGS